MGLRAARSAVDLRFRDESPNRTIAAKSQIDLFQHKCDLHQVYFLCIRGCES